MNAVGVVDVGSTNVRYAAATPAGEFLTAVESEPTRPYELCTQLGRVVETLTAAASLDAVSIVVPGLVDADGGSVRRFDTADGDVIERTEIASPLRDRCGLPVFLENDCTASALGEWRFGAREDQTCVIQLTVGTGIGGGVVERGRLLRGETGGAGEFGLIPVAPDSILESAGVTGAWEAFCSGRGIPSYVRHRYRVDEVWDENAAGEFRETLAAGEEFAAPAVFDAAAAGDPFAQTCLDRINRYNAVGLAALCNAYEPGLVTVGGSVALNNADRFLEGVDRYLEEYLFVDRPTIRESPLGEALGLYGALSVALDRAAR
ncbi:ROK family protein [Natronococcus sp. A-GB1]|uniref:ROK family protein n=1 Tax=Natronococcus sp. A-GB1 TaxID=3037648 RepID=UPI00241C791E|nr:ROK family protein [Natronococcus sp. A-GB1]MDG5759916.1 ROK family protein [Natronococcus sp. A-GB1]